MNLETGVRDSLASPSTGKVAHPEFNSFQYEPLVSFLDRKAIGRSPRLTFRWVPATLRWTALLAIALGALGLHIERSRSAPVTSGLNVMLLIDVSKSMLAQDFVPSRLGAALRVAEGFVTRRPTDRFAVMTFAGDVVLECPLTDDHPAILATLRDISPSNRRDGTALGEAVTRGLARLDAGTPSGSRLLVILSDGAGNGDALTPNAVAAAAAASRVRVYAIGIGGTGPVPYPTEFGTLSVTLDLDESALRSIAGQTGGRFFRAADAPSFESAFEALDSLERAQLAPSRSTSRLSLVSPLACLALSMLLMEAVVSLLFFGALVP
jgi:Ca-activated chloride channel homolog